MAFEFNLNVVLNTIKQANEIVKTVTSYINDAQKTGHVLTSQSEEEIEKAIVELEALLPGLRETTQNKLRGPGAV